MTPWISLYSLQHEREHLNKAQHNLQHLKDVELKTQTCPDWVVTVAFYLALHYVEAFFTKTGLLEDQDHEIRNQMISASSDPELKEIRGRYLALYSKCRLARYDPRSHIFIKPKDVGEYVKDASDLIPRSLGYAP